ncbi:DUF5689 domain-containing protein [Flavobacterium sp.]|uniref:DUF5689 domain-containing protein n=1 Tax=Flavobacterium sp. TaxID=239 RepID=UPI0012253E47|nr:DUF5689 domain-containing protein [Flavobacterium sp.]RZJ72384.1 MAG: hypothetical protein EOO49_05585 [Flavobacterium sp.]
MKSIIKKSALLLLALGLTVSCVNSDDYSAPANDCVDPGLVANKAVLDVKNAATSSPVLYESATEDIIEGYVTSNDEKGNFFKTVYLQTLPTDGTDPIGFAIALDVTTMYGYNFIPGRKVYVKMNGLYTAVTNGILTIGALYQPAPTDTPSVGRIAEGDWKKNVFVGCEQVEESELLRHVTITQAYTNAVLGTLIEIDNVQFADGSVGRKFYDVDSGGGATNHALVSSSVPPLSFAGDGIIRFSSFASFINETVPAESGSIRGVMTKFGSTFQFMVRSQSDIHLSGPRVDAYPALVGANIQFNPTFNETFESYPTTSNYNGQTLANLVNDANIGSKYWSVRTFSSNKYAQFSSFNSNQSNTVYLAFPVLMTPGNKFSFQTKDGFNNGAVLKVYYSTNYVAGQNVDDATLVDITSNFTIASGSTSGYATNFTNSGNYTIPAGVTGNGFFLIKYTGNSTGITTTMQIDNVKVTP